MSESVGKKIIVVRCRKGKKERESGKVNAEPRCLSD